MKYKIGDILKVKKGCESKCVSFFTNKGSFIKITSVKNGYDYDILNDKKEKVVWCNCFKDEHLEPLAKDLDNLEVGNEISVSDGGIRTVLGVCGRVIFVSTDDKDIFHGGYTKEELIEDGYTIVQKEVEDIEEITVEEVCKRLGKTVKIVK